MINIHNVAYNKKDKRAIRPNQNSEFRGHSNWLTGGYVSTGGPFFLSFIWSVQIKSLLHFVCSWKQFLDFSRKLLFASFFFLNIELRFEPKHLNWTATVINYQFIDRVQTVKPSNLTSNGINVTPRIKRPCSLRV